MKLLIATPAYAGNMSSHYVGSLMNTMFGIMNDKLLTEFHLLTYDRESLIPRARNRAAKHLLDACYDKLLFIDADISFEYESVKKLVQSDKLIVGGTYPLKREPIQINFNPLQEHVGEENPRTESGFRAYREKWCDPKTKEVEVRHIPTGFMMIDQKVFQKMILAGVPEYSEYNDVDGLEYQYFDFFQTKVRMGKYESEDWGFCSLARELGFKIYLNTGIVNGHIGNYLYEAKL